MNGASLMAFPPYRMIIGLRANPATRIHRHDVGRPRSMAIPRICHTAPAMNPAAMNVPAWPWLSRAPHTGVNSRIGISTRLGRGFQTKPIAARWGSRLNRT